MNCRNCDSSNLHQIYDCDNGKRWDYYICQQCGEITPKAPKGGFPFRQRGKEAKT